jgi:hypothetical protein
MKSEKINYNAFHDDQNEANTNDTETGLKNNLVNKSRFSKKQNKPTYSDFEKNINDIQKNDIQIKNEASKLSSEFNSLLTSTTLEENISPLKKDSELQVIQGLCKTAMSLNADTSKPEGIGSVGIINLILRALLKQRNIINSLNYENNQIKKALNKILKAVEEDNDK